MQRSPGNERPLDRRATWRWMAAVLAIHAMIFLTLVGLAVGYPGASVWISEAVQAEFFAPNVAPTQLAQPSGQTGQMQTARRY